MQFMGHELKMRFRINSIHENDKTIAYLNSAFGGEELGK
jgi:hypothetical protein